MLSAMHAKRLPRHFIIQACAISDAFPFSKSWHVRLAAKFAEITACRLQIFLESVAIFAKHDLSIGGGAL